MRELEEAGLREFHLDARLRENGATEEARFICTTKRFGRMNVLGFDRIDPATTSPFTRPAPLPAQGLPYSALPQSDS
jgi:hypothetical protein